MKISLKLFVIVLFLTAVLGFAAGVYVAAGDKFWTGFWLGYNLGKINLLELLKSVFVFL